MGAEGGCRHPGVGADCRGAVARLGEHFGQGRESGADPGRGLRAGSRTQTVHRGVGGGQDRGDRGAVGGAASDVVQPDGPDGVDENVPAALVHVASRPAQASASLFKGKSMLVASPKIVRNYDPDFAEYIFLHTK